MPFKEEMSWDASKKRWHRMHEGVMYRVTASKLGGNPTRDDTRQAANAWWRRKERELDAPPRTETDVLYDEFVEAAASPPVRQAVEAIAGLLPTPAKAPLRSVKAVGDSFLQLVKGDMRPVSFKEVRTFIEGLGGLIPQLSTDMDVTAINEDAVEKLYLHLRNGPLSVGAKKKRWDFFRRFVKYAWEKRLVEMPRNLDSHSFEVRAGEIKTYPNTKVKEALAAMAPRLRLYALLGLNCGCINSDIGALRHDQVDLEAGRLVRKRVKTSDVASVPKVDDRLWPETLELLKGHRSTHPELFPTSSDNTPLWTAVYKGETGVARKDLINLQAKRAKVPIPLKAYRSIAATIQESHESYGRYKHHVLGHSPKSVADTHYAAPSGPLFDTIMGWIRGQQGSLVLGWTGLDLFG